MEKDSQLVPILREGIKIVKMIVYKHLKDHLESKSPHLSSTDIKRISGVLTNTIFGTPNTAQEFVTFESAHQEEIKEVLREFPFKFAELRIPITDALRIQIICDAHENIDSTPILKNAEDLRVLLVARDMPLPNNFVEQVRQLGDEYDLLLEMEQAPDVSS